MSESSDHPRRQSEPVGPVRRASTRRYPRSRSSRGDGGARAPPRRVSISLTARFVASRVSPARGFGAPSAPGTFAAMLTRPNDNSLAESSRGVDVGRRLTALWVAHSVPLHALDTPVAPASEWGMS